jgi:hypothetical protein
MYYWEFIQEGDVQRKIHIILSRTGRVVFFFCVFLFDPAIFGNPCRSESVTVWAPSSENSSCTFFCHDTNYPFVIGYTEPYTPSNTLSVIVSKAFWQVSYISGMVGLWAICLLGMIQLLGVFSSDGTERMNNVFVCFNDEV